MFFFSILFFFGVIYFEIETWFVPGSEYDVIIEIK